MPTDVMVVIQGNSNLPEDRFVNTLHFDGAFGAGQAEELANHYITFWNACGASHAGGDVHQIRWYEPGPNPGGPEGVYNFSLGSASAGGLPTEVAFCLSYATVDDFDASTPRRRGRIYLGPLTPGVNSNGRPSVTLIDAALDLGEAIATVGTASETTWVMHSRTDNAYFKIESVSVDNAFDTQRRRGVSPTARETRDVQ